MVTPVTYYNPDFKIPDIKPYSAWELEAHEQNVRAYRNKWTFHPLSASSDSTFWIWPIEDGNHHIHEVRVYPDTYGFHFDCTCDTFNSHLLHCQHVEIASAVASHRGFLWEPNMGVWRHRPALSNSCRFQHYTPKTGYTNFGSGLFQHSTRSYLYQKEIEDFLALPERDLQDLEGLTDLTPFPHQRIALEIGLKAKRSLCALPIGSGKTLTAIMLLNYILKYENPNARLLIILPKSLINQWREELQRHTSLSVVYLETKRVDAWLKGNQAGLITYETYLRNADKFEGVPLTFTIADEIQKVRNPETKLYKALGRLNTEYFMGLSGTMIENSLEDLHAIGSVIQAKAFGPRWFFQDAFMSVYSTGRNKILFKGVKNLAKLKESLRGYVFSANVKVAPFPVVTTHSRHAMEATEQAAHDNYLQQIRKLQAEEMGGGSPNPMRKLIIQGLYVKCRQAASDGYLLTKQECALSSKTQAIIDHITHLVSSGQKVVVYSEWTEYLERIQRALPEIPKSYLHGGLSAGARLRVVEAFTKGPSMVFFSTDAGGAGLDGLQHVSNHILHCEVPWNPARLDQRTGRLNRIGQTKEVNSTIFVSSNSVEEDILSGVGFKTDLRNSVLYDEC